LTLLSHACELEHSLACAYLYAAFSLKQSGSDGLVWHEVQRIRRWAAQLYFVASQEMLHLAQVWNLLAAIGGVPYFGRAVFPQRPRQYPLDMPLSLAPFTCSTLETFIAFERPEPLVRALLGQPSTRDEVPTLDESFRYATVGQLYDLIRSGFEAIPVRQLFIGDCASQVDADLAHFPDIVKVYDTASARLAIGRIVEQGEGAPEDRVDCHYGIFRQIRDEWTSLPTFPDPARPALTNPELEGSPQSPRRLSDLRARRAADLFDDVYGLMLRMLAYTFTNSSADAETRRLFAHQAIELMVAVIKPLGEGLTQLPSGTGDRAAGAVFDIGRVVGLPQPAMIARTLVAELASELVQRAEAVTEDCPEIAALRGAANGLRRVGLALMER